MARLLAKAGQARQPHIDEAAVAYVATHLVSKLLCDGQLIAQRIAYRIIYVTGAMDAVSTIPT